MKKYFYSLFAAAAMLLATASCSQEEDFPGGNGQETNVTFTVKTSETTATRAIAEGVEVGGGDMANHLIYAVYESGKEDAKALIQNKVEESPNGVFKVTVPLVKGIAYDIVFFAYNEEGNAFGITSSNYKEVDLTNLTLNKTLLANKEAYDAFYWTEKSYKASAATEDIKLYRPFAQLNVGTLLKDLANAADLSVKVTKSEIKVNGAYTTFNALKGTVDNPVDELVYTSSELLSSTTSKDVVSSNGNSYSFDNEALAPIEGKTDTYYYLSLAYILADTEKTLPEVSVSFYKDEDTKAFNELVIPSLPIQRNWRTNIIGNLLTSAETFEIVIVPEFNGEYNRELWDGSSVKEVVAENNVYTITTAAELAWVAQQVNNKETFSGKTVKLASDIDLNNKTWTPIGLTGDETGFQGTFDGQDHTIFNLVIKQEAGYQSAGLFGCIANATIKNFTIENATVENYTTGNSHNQSSCGTAVVVGSANQEGSIKNVKVIGAEVKSNRYAAGIAGYFRGTISGCSVEDITLTATQDDFSGSLDNGDKVGVILAYANGAVTLTDNTVNDFIINAYRDCGGIAGCVLNTESVITGNKATNGSIVYTKENAKAIVGRTAENVNYESGPNSSENVTITQLTSTEKTLQEQIDEATGPITLPISGTVEIAKLTISGGKDVTLVAATKDATFNGQLFVSGKLTVKGLTLSNEEATTEGISKAKENAIYVQGDDAVVTVEDCTFEVKKATAITSWWESGNGTNVIVKNSVFNCYGNRPLQIEDNATIEGCTFNDPYRYACQLTSSDATINFKNNVITQSTTSGKPTYGLQLTSDYGNSNLTINGEGNVIKNADVDDALYVWEPGTGISNGYVDYQSITFNTTDGKPVCLADGDITSTTLQYVGDKTVYIAETVKLGNISNTTINISGANENAAIDLTATANSTGSTLNASDLKVIGTNTNYIGFHGINTEKYTNCVFENSHWTYAFNVSFKECTFNQTGNAYNVWLYQYATASFENCKFNCAGKALLIYREGADKYNVTVNNCTFTSSEKKDKAAIQMHTEKGINGILTIKNTKATGFADVNGGLWNEIVNSSENIYNVAEGTPTNNFKKIIDGKEVIAEGLAKTADVTYEVSSANGLAALNEMFSKKTVGKNAVINITSDIDFSGKTWTPVDSHADTSTWLSEINGNGHTISNLTVDGQAMFTRFAGSGDVTIKNLTFDNATVTSDKLNTSILTVQSYQNVTLNNVDVKNSAISGTYKVAPLIASVYDENPNATKTLTLKNCDVVNTTVKGSLDFMVCGMIAWVATSEKEAVTFENCTVDNVTLQIPTESEYNSYAYIYSTDGDAAGSVNEAVGVTVTNCKAVRY